MGKSEIKAVFHLTNMHSAGIVVSIEARQSGQPRRGEMKMAITGNYSSGARNQDRGSSAEKWEQAAEMQAAAAKQKAGQVARLQAHLQTLPPQISGFDVNPKNGEVPTISATMF